MFYIHLIKSLCLLAILHITLRKITLKIAAEVYSSSTENSGWRAVDPNFTFNYSFCRYIYIKIKLKSELYFPSPPPPWIWYFITYCYLYSQNTSDKKENQISLPLFHYVFLSFPKFKFNIIEKHGHVKSYKIIFFIGCLEYFYNNRGAMT